MNVLDLFSGTGGASEAFLRRGHSVIRIDNDERFRNVPKTKLYDLLDNDTIISFLQGLAAVGWTPDVIWASPPCQAFSLAATGTHMFAHGICAGCGATTTKHHERWVCNRGCGSDRVVKDSLYLAPRTDFGKLSVSLVEKTLSLIDLLKPKFWWMENPNGGMIHFVPNEIPRVQITQCQYGENRQKLTNLWGRWPDEWTPRPRCKNGASCPNCGGTGAVDHAPDGTFGSRCERCDGTGRCHAAAPRGAKTGTQGIKGAVARAAIPYELSEEICIASEKGLDN